MAQREDSEEKELGDFIKEPVGISDEYEKKVNVYINDIKHLRASGYRFAKKACDHLQIPENKVTAVIKSAKSLKHIIVNTDRAISLHYVRKSIEASYIYYYFHNEICSEETSEATRILWTGKSVVTFCALNTSFGAAGYGKTTVYDRLIIYKFREQVPVLIEIAFDREYDVNGNTIRFKKITTRTGHKDICEFIKVKNIEFNRRLDIPNNKQIDIVTNTPTKTNMRKFVAQF
eukprot:465526_1